MSSKQYILDASELLPGCGEHGEGGTHGHGPMRDFPKTEEEIAWVLSKQKEQILGGHDNQQQD